MAEGETHAGGGEPGSPHGSGPDLKKGGLNTKKTKWYLVGGLAIIAVLVFLFVKKSNANAGAAGNATNSAVPGAGLDPTTQAMLEQALANQSSSLSGMVGPQGPLGSSGPAGPAGAAGPPGPTGPAGPGTPAPKPPPTPAPKPKPPGPTTGSGAYTVKSGDTLSSIASHFDIDNWHTLYNANRSVIGSNPNMIHVGTRLTIPRG